MGKKIKAVIENHFDQIWRRCFKRDFVWKGQRFISYAEIEKNYIDKNLELSENDPDYKFQIESPCAVETYLELCPEKRETLKSLYANGVLKTCNTGYVILDSNVVGTEAIIRNYLISDAFFKEYAGETPRIANRSDAFGSSAQLPQILRAFGAEYVTEICYNPHDDDVWVGLDKSALCVKQCGHIGGGGIFTKYPPCSKCHGFGKIEGVLCDVCSGLGIDRDIERQWRDVCLRKGGGAGGVMRVGGEEFMPNPNTPAQIAKIRDEQGVDISLGHWDYLLEFFRKEIDQVNNNDFGGLKVRTSPEFNPNTTGGYTTRIKIKQRLCDTENKLLAGETLEAMRFVGGELPRFYDKIWRNYLLCGFHDSAMGTVVDQGYDEIMDMFSNIEDVVKERYLNIDGANKVCLFNPTSSKFNGIYKSEDGRIALINGLAPYSFTTTGFEIPFERSHKELKEMTFSNATVLTGAEEKMENADGDIVCIENEYFTVEADDKGIRKITHKQYGALAEPINGIRPCEWIIEDDTGSPWAKLAPPLKTMPLKERTSLTCIERSEGYTKLCYKTTLGFGRTNIPADSYIEWSLMLVNGYNRIRLNAEVKWIAADKRLMMAFPLSVENSKDIYGIPGGWLEREPYEPDYSFNGADGDWPAFRYGGVETETKSIAVINCGTPAYKILPAETGKMLYMTVLRSPTNPTYLHEPMAYEMTEYDGMRDEGMHSFDFELAAYGSTFAKSSVVRDAEQFSRPLLCVKEPIADVELPTVKSGAALVTHIKPAEDGDGIIVRVTEHGGEDGEAEIYVPAWAKRVCLTDMPEKKNLELPFDKTVKLTLRAFEIATLRFIK